MKKIFVSVLILFVSITSSADTIIDIVGDIHNFNSGDAADIPERSDNLLDAFNVIGYENIIDLHAKSWEKDDYLFLGYGTGGFAQTDPEFRKIAREWRRKVKDEKIIMVLHGPPHGTKLDDVVGEKAGNRDFTAGIKRLVPKLVICGHLHENAGKIDFIGKTQIINPSSPISIIYIERFNRFLILDDEFLNSYFIQMYVLENYDKNLFEPVA